MTKIKKVPIKELVTEHERLVDALQTQDKKKLNDELEEQSEELKEYKQEAKKSDVIEVTPDGKQEMVPGKEPLKKKPKAPHLVATAKPINPKDPILNPEKFEPKVPSDKNKQVYAQHVQKLVRKSEEEVKARWDALKKGLNNLESIMDLAAASQPEEQPQEPDQQEEQPQVEGGTPQSMDENTQPGDEESEGDQGDEGESDELTENEPPSDQDSVSEGDENTQPGDEESQDEEPPQEGEDDSEQKIIQALQDEGYSDSEIAYIVHGHHSPTYDESKEAKAHATYAMADVDTDNAKKQGEMDLEAKKKQMELDHGHQARMKDLEFQHAQMQSPDPETEKNHKKRMLDLEYENAKAQSPDGSDKEHQKRMMDLEYQQAQATAPDPEIAKQMAQMDLEERKLQLEQRKAEIKLELEFKKKEHELKLKHAEQLAAKKLKEKLAEPPAKKKKTLKKSVSVDGVEQTEECEEVDDE